MDRLINLCDTCANSLPECSPDQDEMEYGDGPGLDNVIKCPDYANGEDEGVRHD